MADYDLVKAVVAALRGVPAIATPLAAIPTSAGGGTMNARIYGAFVPPDSYFPRAYVRRRPGPKWRRWPVADGGIDRTATIDVLFATTTAITADPEDLIETLDEAAQAAIEAISLPHLVHIWRTATIPAYDQTDDRNTYITGGSSYEYSRQYG